MYTPSKESVEELMQILKEECGQTLSYAEAASAAEQLIALYSIGLDNPNIRPGGKITVKLPKDSKYLNPSSIDGAGEMR